MASAPICFVLGFLEPFCGTAGEGFSFLSYVLCSLNKPGWRNAGGRVLTAVEKKYWTSLNAILMVVAVQDVCNGLLWGWMGGRFSAEAATGEGQSRQRQAGRDRQPHRCEGRLSYPGQLQP